MEKKVTKKDAAKQYRENNNRVVEESVDGFVVLKDVNKVYDNRVQAVYDFNLSVAQNEFIVLVGPSGCGKSTTLRMIAGLEEITSGYLYIDRILSNYLESKDRDIAMVFQSYALYPNMSVFDNIGFGLKVRGVPKDEIKKRVFDAADYAYVGIRPEDVHFASDFKGNKSETLAVTAEFVELLGSELCVYFDIGDNRVIMKSGLARMIKTGDAAELCFDMDKLRLFDAISCERVL